VADLKDIGGPGAIAGWTALIGMLIRLLWDAGDRYEKKLAATILASGKVKSAVGDVAIRAVVDSKELVMANVYELRLNDHQEKLDRLLNKVDEMSDYLHSDQLARAVVAAMNGNPTRRDHSRT